MKKKIKCEVIFCLFENLKSIVGDKNILKCRFKSLLIFSTHKLLSKQFTPQVNVKTTTISITKFMIMVDGGLCLQT